jgi:hypothetical protein
MKKKITLILLSVFALSSIAYGQDKFIFNEKGLNPKFIVVDVDSVEQSELFKKTVNWIKETYKNPDEVIKTTIGNEKIRFEGYTDVLFCVNSLGAKFCYSGLYTIEVEFKDNKFKLTPLSLEYKMPNSAGGMMPIDLNDGAIYYNKKGVVRNYYKTVPNSIDSHFNDLNMNLTEYLKTGQEENVDDGW